jgi:alpha-ketoglutarate-dependent sulfate ester dioxygenase
MSADGHLNAVDVDLTIRPVTGRIGAEIRGVRLSPTLSEPTVRAIRAALLEHKVIFFRDQDHLNDADQESFAALLGQPVAHPTVPVLDGSRYILELDSGRGGRANSWHTDVSFAHAYPQASVLRAVVSPEVGGDTVWANTASAYQDLPPELKTLADGLWATHSNLYDYAAAKPNASAAANGRYLKVFASTVYETDHPVVRVHPETGERTLVLGHFLRRLKGYSAETSNHLFAILQGYVTRLDNTVRWRWRAGDVAVWDNRATQHYAIDDYGDQPRVMRRVTIDGDVPVSVDGRPSTTRTVDKAA